MPPFLASFKSRTNSLLDTITGIIPDSPTDGTSKDRSLTCRRCGNRFRDALELSSHFNLLPHHSDYSDSHDYASFVRPKVRRQRKPVVEEFPHTCLTGPAVTSFSEVEPVYPSQDKENDDTRPALLRKFPTFSSLNIGNTGDQQPSSSATDYLQEDADSPRSPTKGKGKQKAPSRPRRENSFPYGQPLASSDEEGETSASGPSTIARGASAQPRTRSATVPAFTSESLSAAPSGRSTPSMVSRSSRNSREAPSLPPKLPQFDWTSKSEKPLALWRNSEDDAASVASDNSFRTAGSSNKDSEKSNLKKFYAQQEAGEQTTDSGQPSSSAALSRRPNPSSSTDPVPPPISRHASESNLLLESMGTSHDDAPPSYHELHGDTDPFETSATSSQHRPRHWPSRRALSRSDGLATMPTSPVSRFDSSMSRRPRRATNVWPVTFAPFDSADAARAGPSGRSTEDDLYNTSSEKRQMHTSEDRSNRPAFTSKSTDASLPPLVSSSSFSSLPPSPMPKTPFTFFDDAPLVAPPLSLPRPSQSSKSNSGAARRSRHASRAKSDSTEPSTRCPTCFLKFASLDKTLQHLDNSDCGAVDFESGIM